MKKNVTLVLSGGGARGIAHIGVIEEIERRGYEIKSICGTSMGALVGGVYASGKIQVFKNWLYTLDKQHVFSLIDFTLSSHGFIKGDRVLKTMKEFIPDANIEDLKIKYTATAFDLAQNKEIVFSEGSLYHAIRASIAIPTVFTPVESGKSVIVDGGVVNNIPIKNAIRTENDILIAVYVNADIPVYKPYLPQIEKKERQNLYLKKIKEFKGHIFKTNPQVKIKKMNYFDLINNTLTSMTNHIALMSIKNYPPDILIEISRKTCSTFDFFKAEELVEIGRFAAYNNLNLLKE
jgi:NTE family protein